VLTLLQDRKSLRFTVAAAVLWGLFSLGYILGPLGEESRTWVANLGTLLGAWTVVVLAGRLWRSCDPGEAARRIWLAFFFGFLLWAIGETLWAFYDLQAGANVPYPSIADVAWTAGYPLLCAALWIRYRSLEVRPDRGQWLALGLIVVVGIFVFGFVLWPILTYPGYDRLIEQALDLMYPVGGLILFAGSVLVAAAVRGGRLSPAWQVIALGIAVLSLADLVFAYATWNDMYVIEGTPNVITLLADVPYMGAYAAIAVGEYVLGRLEGTF
jgi:hypothetical protein